MANPYAPPAALVEDIADPSAALEPADRGTRLVAAILDGIIAGMMVYMPLIVGFLIAGVPLAGSAGGVESAALNAAMTAMIIGLALASIGLTVWASLTIKYVRNNGQTIAKKLLNIKVVRSDGSPASLARIFWLRNIVNTLISLVPLYTIVDHLFIFGESRQCLHDKLADTIVIKA
jgi:uncharacterized RDD family membrane protein YckC